MWLFAERKPMVAWLAWFLSIIAASQLAFTIFGEDQIDTPLYNDCRHPVRKEQYRFVDNWQLCYYHASTRVDILGQRY